MSLFPIFVKLEGRTVLVVGAGSVAQGKIGGLLAAGALVRVVAPEATSAVTEWAQQGVLAWEQRTFAPSDLDDAFLVIAATSSTSLNHTIFTEARRRNVLCNAVDDPDNCDFYYPAVVRRGDFQIAISTAGHSPALAQRLRQELEVQFGAEYASWVEELGKYRQQLMASRLDPEARKQMLHDIASRQAFESMRGEQEREKLS
ncbi:MAG TPA: bifunctional precorrin-2 dehydrogenase/sirohydrochlorin ferrochelatase [Terriglobales bacterium]